MIDYAGSNVLGRSEYASESGRRPPSGMKWSVFAKQTKKGLGPATKSLGGQRDLLNFVAGPGIEPGTS